MDSAWSVRRAARGHYAPAAHHLAVIPAGPVPPAGPAGPANTAGNVDVADEA